jgi:hypothetical protein
VPGCSGNPVAAYRFALEVYTREALPQDWATTQNNLGAALRAQAIAGADDDGVRLLEEAVRRLSGRPGKSGPAEALPQDWATTQNNLANALGDLAADNEDGDRAGPIGEAVAAYRAALEVRTRDSLPQRVGGASVGRSGTRSATKRRPRKARTEAACSTKRRPPTRASLEIRTRAAFPEETGRPPKQFGNRSHRSRRVGRGMRNAPAFCGGEALSDPFTLGRSTSGRASRPREDWLRAQSNVANTLRGQAMASTGDDRVRLLGEAVATYFMTLDAVSKKSDPIEWAEPPVQHRAISLRRQQYVRCLHVLRSVTYC